MDKTVIKYIEIGLIAVGGVGLFLGGSTEGFGVEVIASVFTIMGIIMKVLKKA